MLAYNLNCSLMLFNREPQADATALKHTTPATSRSDRSGAFGRFYRHPGTATLRTVKQFLEVRGGLCGGAIPSAAAAAARNPAEIHGHGLTAERRQNRSLLSTGARWLGHPFGTVRT